ncbi:hypothetical protein FACS1894155_10690 [Bacteroidia bacterium]|nr:hypothetical protein FACS1894155_10690 [Bacteroidia bacterium]
MTDRTVTYIEPKMNGRNPNCPDSGLHSFPDIKLHKLFSFSIADDLKYKPAPIINNANNENMVKILISLLAILFLTTRFVKNNGCSILYLVWCRFI